MAGQVFYRKWRPQRFGDVVGQEYATQTLLNALNSGRVAHAYLFCGPRGTGKTSTARIMAKALNCQRNGGTGEPCNECLMCIATTEGRAMDLIEIDAASNRGIDEMRSIREKVNFAPNEGRYKIYIIDEVHMLTEPAFNALLKTLEEPPPRTVFILATTDPDKLPPTVISRCQRFDFRRITVPDIVGRLEKLCQDEGIQATREVLLAVARGAAGGLRDAENIFEQLVVGYGQHLEMAQLREFLGMGGEEQVRELAAAALSSDVATGLRVISDAMANGLDPRQFHRQFVEYLRVLLLLKAGVPEAVEQFPEARQEMEAVARSASLDHILRAVKLFGQVDLKNNSYSTLPLELALVETAAVPDRAAAAAAPSPAAIVPQRPAVARATVAPPAAMPDRPPAAPPFGMPAGPPVAAPTGMLARPPSVSIPPAANAPPSVGSFPSEGAKGANAAWPNVGPVQGPPFPAPSAAAPPLPLAPESGPLATLKEHWQAIIEASKAPGQKIKIDVLLRSGEPVAVDGEGVLLAFPYEKFVDMMRQELENPGSRRALEEAFAGVLGQRRAIRFEVRAKPKRSGGHLLKAVMEMGARVVEEEPPS